MKEVRGDIEHHTLVVHWVGFLFPGGSFFFLHFFAVEKKDHLYEWICEHKGRTYRFAVSAVWSSSKTKRKVLIELRRETPSKSKFIN